MMSRSLQLVSMKGEISPWTPRNTNPLLHLIASSLKNWTIEDLNLNVWAVNKLNGKKAKFGDWLTLHNRWMDRSTSSETATKIVSTEATDHVGVRANDLDSCAFSAIANCNRLGFRNVVRSKSSTLTQPAATQCPCILRTNKYPF